MSQWMGNLFYRKQQISEITSLRYAEMKYWNEWHEIMIKADKKAIDEANKKNA